MPELNYVTSDTTQDFSWRSLCKGGGVAALIAGVIFRRNIAAELGIFNLQPAPTTINDWFVFLQHNRFLGLIYLNIFDILNYALVGLMFLALFAVLRQVSKSGMVIALILGIVGITVYFASNTAFSMLSLSNQYASATSEVQKNLLLAAGHAVLSINRFSGPDAYPGTGGYISLLLIALAGLIISIVMIRSKTFNRSTGYVGIIANALDLIYCIAFVFIPTIDNKILAVCFIPAAGFFLMIWHIMIGWRLCRLRNLT